MDQGMVGPEKERRWGAIFISPEFLLDFMKPTPAGRSFRCIEGLPEDVRIVRVEYDDMRGCGTGRYAMVVEHPSFPIVYWPERIPELKPPVFEMIETGENPPNPTGFPLTPDGKEAMK